MTTQSNVCLCDTCIGPGCTCGCQNPVPMQTACRCGDVCSCGDTCSCGACQHRDTRVAESR